MIKSNETVRIIFTFLCPRLYTLINVFVLDMILIEELFFPMLIIENEALYQLIAHKITSSTTNTFDVQS